MNRDETVALFLECEAKRSEARVAAIAQGKSADKAKKVAHEAAKAHWNAWAERMVAERKALEAAGRWAAEWAAQKGGFRDMKPKNEETRAWMENAAADFSRCLFLVKGAEGTREVAGEDKKWSEAAGQPDKSIQLETDRIYLDGFVFPGLASFHFATFTGTVRFESATFTSYALFYRATFTGTAWFESATFSGDASFYRATFAGYATFEGATFDGPADFRSATFQNFTVFDSTKFLKEVRFTGIKMERAFDMTGASFAQVPAFNQADFKQAPDLDDVLFPLPGFWRGGNAELVAQYRALRRMAIQGADYEREQMAYKGEMRARRWTVDKWWSAGTWIGLFYDAFADCGRSIVRPANAWLASILLFAGFYWQRAAAGVEARCDKAGGAAVQALFLSVKNALVIFGGTRDARVNQAYLCLYNGSAEQPRIPPTVTFVETLAQIPVSATLIFLFLLAVKNRFKIK